MTLAISFAKRKKEEDKLTFKMTTALLKTLECTYKHGGSGFPEVMEGLGAMRNANLFFWVWCVQKVGDDFADGPFTGPQIGVGWGGV